MNGIQWGESKPAREALGIHRLKRGAKETAWLLGELVSVYLHWDAQARESLPCLGEACRFCPAKAEERWYAPGLVLGGLNSDTGRRNLVRKILEFNEACARELWDRPARGLRVELSRGSWERAPLILRPTAEYLAEAQLPRAFDVRPCLERIWFRGRSARPATPPIAGGSTGACIGGAALNPAQPPEPK